MTAIEGYTFTVDMQDRGVVATLRQMRAAAGAMKAEMRAGFETIQQGEGSISAYNFKIQQSERQINNYKNMQIELRKELDRLSEKREKEIAETKKYGDANSEESEKAKRALDKTEKAYASVARQIENTQHQINRLTQGIKASREAIIQFNTGLSRARTEAASAKSVMEAYVRSINGQGRAFATSKVQARSYEVQHKALVNQFRAEVAETDRLKTKTTSLRSSYAEQQAAVAKAVREHGQASNEYKKEAAALAGLSEKITKADSEYAKQISTALRVKTSIGEISRAERSVTDGGITRLSRAMNNLDANARRATSHTREWASSVRGSLAAVSLATVPLGMAVGGAVKQSVNLQNEWVKVKNYLYTGADSAKEARSEVSRLSKIESDAKKYSDQYGYSQKEIAEQYGELVKRGYTANASIGSMKSMLQAARASGDDYADVVKNVSGAVDAFGLRSNNTAKMMENTNRVTNAMAFSADKTATDFEGMGNAMSYVAGTAHGAGFSIEQTAAAIGTLSNANIEGTRAGTGLRKVINSLLKPTRGAQDALSKYNMSIDDFKTKSGAMKSLPDIMKIINQHTKDLGKADKGAFFKAVFGATGQESAMMLAQNARELQKLTDQEKDAEKNDYVGKLAKKQMASTQMQLASLKTRLQNIGIVMGNSLLPVINQVAGAFGHWLGSNDGRKALKDFSDNVSGLGRVVGHNSKSIIAFLSGFVEGLSGVVRFSGKVIGLFSGVASAIGKLTGVSKLGSNLPKFIGETAGTILGVVGAFKILKSTVNGMSAIRQDIKSAFHLDGVTAEQSKIDVENKKLQENIDLWKRHNEVSGGDSAIGSNITTSTVEKTGKSKGAPKVSASTVEEELPSRTKLRQAGEVRGSNIGKGIRGGLVRALKGTADLAILTISSGTFDLDMIVGLGKKLGQGLLKGFKLSWKVGKWITKPFTRLIDSNVVRTMFGFPAKEVTQQGTKAGKSFTQGIKQSIKNVRGKLSISGLFKSSGKHAAASGKSAGKSFVESASSSVEKSPKKATFSNLFKGAGKHAATSGAKAGTSFVESAGKTATKSGKLLSYGKTLGSKMGGAATVAFGTIDLLQALTTSNHKNRAKKVGESLGSTAGAAGGMAIGASLGSVVPGVGTVIGGTLGSIIGGVTGGHIGKSLGKAWPKIKKGASDAFKGIGKIIAAPFKWASKKLDKFGSSLKKKLGIGSRSKSTIGAGNYSAKDRRLVQQMTKAVNDYARSLKNLKKVNVRNYFKNLAREIQKSKLAKELISLDRSTRQSAKNWRNLAKPIRTVSNSFRQLQKSVRNLSGRRNGLTALSRDVQTLYRTIRRNPFGKLIAQQSNIANRALSGKRSGFVNEFNRQTNSMKRSLRSFRRTFNSDWKETWSGLARPVNRNLGEANKAENRYLDDMNSDRSKFSSSFLKGWNGWIDDVVSNFRKGFSKLPNYAQSSMKDIISRLNKGISGINSTISSFGGDKKLSSISYANGTNGGHPGGHMLVNDSVRPHWKELVLFPNGQALLPQHRNTLIPNAPRGTQVLSGENTYKFMNSIGVHKYANGTLSESEMDRLSEQFQKHPEEASKELILKFTNWNSKVPVVADFGKASAIAFSRGIANVLKDQMASEANPPGSGVARWRPYIIRAFHALGFEAAEWKVRKLLKQIETESGGNPTIPQQVQDQNSGGNESLGLLQFALSTWNADALPGHKNRASGYDQILAAISVLEKGGEGGWGNVGMGHGWATGGIAARHGLYEMAEGNLPEAIIPFDLNKRPRALSLIDHTLDKMESDGGGTGGLRSRASQARADNENTAYLKQMVTILAQIAGLNKQQIDAILTQGNDDMNSRHKRAQFYQKFGNDQRVSDYMSY